MKHNPNNSLLAAVTVAGFAIAALLAAPSATAADGTWLGTSGNWNATGTWSGGTIADGTGFTANFTGVDIAADQTVTLAADRTIGNITFTDATTSSNNLLITGANLLTLDVTTGIPAINVTQSGRTLTINSVIVGTDGLQKTGAGALTLNGAAVNTFTGGLSTSGGTLTLDYNNLATPTNLVDATNALQINNGALTITGKSTANTSQSFSGTTLGAGVNTINISRNGASGNAILNLGALTTTAGSVTMINPGTAWANGVPSTTEKIYVSSITGKTLPTGSGTGNWINVNAGLFYRTSATAGTARWVNVDNLGQLAPIPGTITAQGVSGTVTVARQINTANITLTGNANSYGLVVNPTNADRTLNLGTGSYTYTINGILGVNTNKTIIAPGTDGTLVIGSERNLVINMDNTGGVDVNAPIVNNSAGASSVTIASTAPTGTTPGTVTFGGANTYTGATTITAGTLNLGLSTSIQNSALDTAGSVVGDATNGLKTTVTTLTMGGLSGNKNLADVFTTTSGGYGGLTALTLNPGAAATRSYSGNIADGAAGMTLTKSGAGTQILGGANSFTGATTVNSAGGALRITHANALGTTAAGTFVNGPTTVAASNGRLELDGGITVTGEAVTIKGIGNTRGALSSFSGTNEWAGNVTIGAEGTRIGASDAAFLRVSGVIDSGVASHGVNFRSGVISAGGGVILSGANTYLGDTNLLIGLLQLDGGDDRLPLGTKLNMGATINTTEFDLNGRNQEIAGLAVAAGATAANNAVNNSSGTLSTLTVNTAAASPSTFAGILKGNLALTKTGTDTLTLNGTNTYAGATNINAGTLYVSGALSNSAATVGATGTIGSNGGSGSLGNGLTIAAGGNLDLTGATIGANSSGILGLTGGSLTLGNLTFQDLVGWDWLNAAAGTYELIDGSFSVDFGTTAYLDAGSAYDFGNGKSGYFTQGSLNVVVIPEPRAAFLGGLGMLALLRRRRN